MSKSIKEQAELTPKQQEQISKFLTLNLESLREENRLGRTNYTFDTPLSESDKRDKSMLENAIIAISRTIWE